MTTVIILDGDGKDISDDVELVNGKANPFGWSSADIQYGGEIIGFQDSGYFHMKSPYTHELRKED